MIDAVKNVSRKDFERYFSQINASWSYEGLNLDDRGKDLIFRRLTGQISEEQFKQVIGGNELMELGKEFETLEQQARKIPGVADYLDMKLTKEQAVGYVMAALKERKFSESEKSEIITEIEKKFLIMRPEEAERIYAESWYA